MQLGSVIREYGPDWTSTWGFCGFGAAIICGGIYFAFKENAFWAWTLALPFAAPCVWFGLMNRRTFLTILEQGVRHRNRNTRPVAIRFSEIQQVLTRTGSDSAIILVLRDGTRYVIPNIANQDAAAVDIASLVR